MSRLGFTWCYFFHRKHWSFQEVSMITRLHTPKCKKCGYWFPGFSVTTKEKSS